MKTVALVPIKMNNERTPGKNTKLLGDGTPLIKCILSTLVTCDEIDEVYVYCSNEEIKKFLIDGVNYLKRDAKYDTASADVNGMFKTFSHEVPADIYVLAHATAPFQTKESIDKGIREVKTGKYDSALAVTKMLDFYWKDNLPANYDTKRIPRTQDLEPIFVETTGLYIFTKNVIEERRSRIGYNPYLLEVSKVEACDINDPIDFEIANAVYMNGLTHFKIGGGTLIDNFICPEVLDVNMLEASF